MPELLALWQRRKPRSPSPRPSPQRRGRTIGRGATHRGLQTSRATTARAPSPRGRGRGQARLSHIGRTRKFVTRPEWLPLLSGEGWEVASKAEARRPKEVRVPKSEDRKPVPRAIRVSAFFRPSFGLRICPAAAQYVFGTCETEPQILAALDKNVRAPKHLRGAPGRTGGEMF